MVKCIYSKTCPGALGCPQCKSQFDIVCDIRQQAVADLRHRGIVACDKDIVVVPTNPHCGIYDIRYRPGVQVQIDSMDLHVADSVQAIVGCAL